jgi:hypothetical protein
MATGNWKLETGPPGIVLAGQRRVAPAPDRTDFQSRSFTFACQIVQLYRALDAAGVPPHLSRQLLRAGTFIGAELVAILSTSVTRLRETIRSPGD